MKEPRYNVIDIKAHFSSDPPITNDTFVMEEKVTNLPQKNHLL